MSYSFANRDGTFLSEQNAAPMRIVTPLTGVVITSTGQHGSLLVNPAGTLAALTVQMPPNPSIGQTYEIGFTQVITALTIQDYSGVAVAGAAGAGAIGVAQMYKWMGTAWIRWR
jgi:hypothetical protein